MATWAANAIRPLAQIQMPKAKWNQCMHGFDDVPTNPM